MVNTTCNRLTTSALRGWLLLAEEVARDAGEYLACTRGSLLKVTANRERDVKLAADHESEGRIIHALRERSTFPILSEESGMIQGTGPDQGARWIVDPLDGSLNYLRGIPLCCVSVGLWNNDDPLLGAVYDFRCNELFSGIVGIGAWLNGDTIQVSQTQERREAVLCTGFPACTDLSSGPLHKFIDHVRQYKKLRLLGSAALSLAYVAAGRADAYYERDIRVWDVAAGLAIVRAAGGVFLQAPSAAPEAMTVYAANPSMPNNTLE